MSKAVELLAIPNVSEGRDAGVIQALVGSVRAPGVSVLDVHSDPRHNRSVITTCGPAEGLVEAMSELALRCVDLIDLETHEGVHPRLGALDVCPFVPWNASLEGAAAAAHAAADEIYRATGLPIYLYGAASPDARQLPEVRRFGTDGLRSPAAPAPDRGAKEEIYPGGGVVCVGARGPLIAFNVWLRGSLEVAKTVAAEIRGPHVRALGLQMDRGEVQVSMNLIAPDEVGIEDAFGVVASLVRAYDAEVLRTELVGLAFERHLPSPGAQAARLMTPPGRSFESALDDLKG